MKKFIAVLLLIILFLSVAPKAQAMEQTPSGLPFTQLETAIDAYAAQHIGVSSPGAAVTVVKDGEVIFSKGYGYADTESKTPIDPAETVFEYGSVSKLFVYVTLMQLYEDGRLDIDADIRGSLPDGFLKKLRYDDPITLRNVMNHTTGFEEILFDLIFTSPGQHPTYEQVLNNAQPVQVYRPGSYSAYSNYAVALAAYIAQGMLGQEYYAYLADSVFTQLGMYSTTAHPTLDDRPDLRGRRATGYYPNADGGFLKGDWSYVSLYPVGSVVGTAEDLARFAIALMPEQDESGPLFTQRETLHAMFSQTYAMGPGMEGFAHGFIEREAALRGVGHGGNTACFSAQINLVPQERFGVIVLTNTAGEMELTEGITALLLGTREPSAASGIAALPGTNEVAGDYIAARRMHSGFLKLYGYLSLLHVQALDEKTVKITYGGQNGTFVQTAPYMYDRVEADGAFFRYHFGQVYFEMQDGAVRRVSGDFMPLPALHTQPWLFADTVLAAVCALFFLLAPFGVLIAALRRAGAQLLPAEHRMRRIGIGMLLSGTAIVANNLILVARMLLNHYRSFNEVRVQILFNYPMTATAIVFGAMAAVYYKRTRFGRQHKLCITIGALLLILIGELIKWQFFAVLY